MIKYLLLLVTLYAGCLYSQPVETNVKLEKQEWFRSFKTIPDHGFLVETTNAIRYFNPDGKQAWEKKVKEEYGMSGLSFLVASPDASVVYKIEQKESGFNNKKHYITRIRSTGTLERFEIDGKKEFGKNLQAIFCDDTYLYYLATENGDELDNRKKTSEKLLLIRFDAQMSPSIFEIKTPPISDGSATTYWSFLGQKGKEMFLASKYYDVESNKSQFTVVAFDSEGKISRTFTIDGGIDAFFTRPALNATQNVHCFEKVSDLDFLTAEKLPPMHVKAGTAPNPTTGIPGIRMIPTNGALTHIMMAPKGDFYVFSLMGPKPYKKAGSQYSGFYIQKFDPSGNLIWKRTQEASKELLDEGIFRVHGVPSDRSIALRVLPNDVLNFSIQFRSKMFTYELSSQGEVIHASSRDEEKSRAEAFVRDSSQKLQADAYLARKPVKKNEYASSFLTTQAEILIVLGWIKEPALKIVSFELP